MPLNIATAFPYNNGDVAPTLTDAPLDPTSLAADVADVNLRRRLVTTVGAAAFTPKAQIEAAADQPVNFVGVIGPSVSGTATVKILPNTGNALNGASGQDLVLQAGKAAFLIASQTYATARKVEVEFPSVPAGSRLECALIITGALEQMQIQPNSIRRRFGQLRLERAAPQGSQVPPASRGIYRMMDLIWTELVQPDRDALRDFLLGVNEHGTVVINDTARTDAPLYGYINGPLDMTDRRFSDYADARMPIEEIIVSA